MSMCAHQCELSFAPGFVIFGFESVEIFTSLPSADRWCCILEVYYYSRAPWSLVVFNVQLLSIIFLRYRASSCSICICSRFWSEINLNWSSRAGIHAAEYGSGRESGDKLETKYGGAAIAPRISLANDCATLTHDVYACVLEQS